MLAEANAAALPKFEAGELVTGLAADETPKLILAELQALRKELVDAHSLARITNMSMSNVLASVADSSSLRCPDGFTFAVVKRSFVGAVPETLLEVSPRRDERLVSGRPVLTVSIPMELEPKWKSTLPGLLKFVAQQIERGSDFPSS